MKNRPALLFCLFACLSFLPVELNAQGIYTGGGAQPVGSQSLLAGDYWSRTARNYNIHATVGTNGSLSMLLYDHPNGIVAEGGIPGVVTDLASGLVHVSFGEAGYLKARGHRSHTKLVGRLVLRTGDKVKTRRCVLERYVPDPGHGLVMVMTFATAVGAQVSSPPVIVTREAAEALIELRWQELQQQNNPGSATILPPTRLGDVLAPPPPVPPAP